MSGLLTRETEQAAESTADGGASSLRRAVKVVTEETDSDGTNRTMPRTFVVLDVSEAIRSLTGRRGEASGIAETAAELAPQPEQEPQEQEQERRGRSRLTRLFLAGVVVGLVYALRSRSESVDEVVGRATDRTQRVAGTAAERTSAITETAAERIQETGEQTADRIEEGGEEAADRIQETGEQAADQMEEAAETATDVEEEAAEAAGEGSEESEGDEADEE